LRPPNAAGSDVRPEFKPEQEVRFAVVMYGGVSLAIYINGVAQELFRLVRATAPERPYAEASAPTPLKSPRQVYVPSGEEELGRKPLAGSEVAYRKLGQSLNLTGPPTEPPDSSAPVRTRFVVDIISGTSAGGINGVFLGRAIAEQQDFGVSADLWRKTADIDALLNDDASYAPPLDKAPRDSQSLLNGRLLYWRARDALARMAEHEEDPTDKFRPAYAEQLDLAVTSTDLGGVPSVILMSGGEPVLERSHRAVFRFTYGTEAATGEEHSDFEDADLMLGFAARATSSFPFAFEPVMLADLLTPSYKPDADAAVDAKPFFPDYRGLDVKVEELVFGDGGYLDNKPFSYATERLRARRADVPVTRHLIYIEPHPTIEQPAGVIKRPDVFGSVGLSMSLPRQETIRADVAAVTERNHVVERLRELGTMAESALEPAPAVDAESAPYRAYKDLRVRTVLDWLTTFSAAIRKGDEDDTIGLDTRARLREWNAKRTADERRELLADCDAAFRQRRLSFLHDRVNELLRGGDGAARMIEFAGRIAPGTVPADALASLGDHGGGLRDLKMALNGAIDALRRVLRAPQSQHVIDVLGADRAKLYGDVVTQVNALPGATLAYLDAVRALLRGALSDVDREIEKAIASAEVPDWIADLLKTYDERFAEFDVIVLPLAYPDLGETNAVSIMRISPLDAPHIRPDNVEKATDKLGGTRFHHFGAFLKGSWRDNDLMWGRLDAAEAIIGALYGNTADGHGKELREGAQAAILREELRRQDATVLNALAATILAETKAQSLDDLDDDVLVASFVRNYKPLAELDPTDQRRIAGRSAGITGRVLSDGAKDRNWPRWPFRMIRWQGPGAARTALWIKDKASLRPHVQLRWPPLRWRRKGT
jgi:patatin-related protein